MKKTLLLFLAALAISFSAQAKVTVISPGAENDALRLAVHYAEDGDTIEMTEGTYDSATITMLLSMARA